MSESGRFRPLGVIEWAGRPRMSKIDPERTIIDMFRFERIDGVYARISKWKRATRIGPIECISMAS